MAKEKTDPFQLPPHDEAIEQKLVAGAMMYPMMLDEIDPPLKGGEDGEFFILPWGILWEAIMNAHRKGRFITTEVVREELSKEYKNLADHEYLGLLMRNYGPSAEQFYGGVQVDIGSIPDLAAIVRKHAEQRRWLAACGEMAQQAWAGEGDFTSRIHDIFQAYLAKVETPDDTIMSFKEAASELFDDLLAIREGIKEPFLPTGFPRLDRKMHGLGGGQLIMVAARPGNGKSTLILQWGVHAAVQQDRRVLVFSMEMIPKEILKRVVAQEAGIDTGRQYAMSDEDWMRFVNWTDTADRSIRFDYKTIQTPLNIANVARREARRHGVDLIIIDYLQLMDGDRQGQNRNYELAAISRQLKNLAVELDIPIVCAVQMNRNIESGFKRLPKKDDLKDSGNLEQDADKILFIHSEHDLDEDDGVFAREVKFVLAKHRNGPEGVIDMLFQPDKVRFVEPYLGEVPRVSLEDI